MFTKDTEEEALRSPVDFEPIYVQQYSNVAAALITFFNTVGVL